MSRLLTVHFSRMWKNKNRPVSECEDLAQGGFYEVNRLKHS